jgi:hypothetical protein
MIGRTDLDTLDEDVPPPTVKAKPKPRVTRKPKKQAKNYQKSPETVTEEMDTPNQVST